MNTKRNATFFILLLASAMQAALALEPGCTIEQLHEVNSLAALPPPVAKLLGAARRGTDGIAESNAEFSSTDVVVGDMPMRRFALAAIGTECALVAIERGGRGYSIEMRQFALCPEGWRESGRETLAIKPISISELTAAATHVPQ